MIESYATINWGLGDKKLWRKPDILADATLKIFEKEPRGFTGNALIDEDFLRGEGVDRLHAVPLRPEHEPPKLGFDFKVNVGR
jgi:hypothetical protein